ncbi:MULTISPECIES: SDR family NAD(P)-dependent oxidoreductase [Pseudofrankia]|uniref:SDR family NAD(P)-dependent oxidoreductase n=1 Tax=Pseudofrankia TaxID=2994363 RepID=UPI000234C4F8|nr:MULTISPECIES: SDR family NAD(P)-dependent oxidoreductase [Pseudofrankia]OHV41050.1 hypothetical protein BCD49_38960 [Pseudofrankia sp. EUN1h]
MPFEGTTAIVTGGASGLGLAITEALAARGTKVAVFDVQAELLDTEVARMQKHGDAVHGYVVDVSNRAQVTAARRAGPRGLGARHSLERYPRAWVPELGRLRQARRHDGAC